MDDLQEHNVVKNERQLHDDLRAYIQDYGTLVRSASSQRDKYEHSKLLLGKIITTISEFEPSPKLLDSGLGFYMNSLTDSYFYLHNQKKVSNPIPYHYSGSFTQNIGHIVYQFSKIRGFKHITNYFSSDVYLIPRLIEITKSSDNDNELFLCLIWLSNLVLVPFKLDHIDSSLTSQLLVIGIENLKKHANASKNQLVASILLSRLLTRSDIMAKTDYLNNYFKVFVEPEWQILDRLNGSVKLGHLITINKLLKRCPTEVLEPHIGTIYSLISIDLMNLRIQEENSRKHLNNLNVLYMIKILSKLSMIHVKQGDFEQTAIIVNHLLNNIMNLMSTFDTTLRYAMAKSMAQLTKGLSLTAVNFQEQVVEYMIDQLDLNLVPGEPFNSSIEIENDAVFISKYHTIILFFGFTALENSFPLRLVPTVLSIIHKTLFLEQRRLSSVLGSQVRDSSCFVLWALCRIIKQEIFLDLAENNPQMMDTILFDLILVIIMDSELIIRRCGVAVIQELVGRFGSILFRSYLPDTLKLGEFIVNFIEVFGSSKISSLQSSYELIEELVSLGFSKELFIPKVLENTINENLKFEIRKLSCSHLQTLFRTDSNPIDFGIRDQTFYTLDEILDTLASRDLYFISSFLEQVDEKAKSKYIESLAKSTQQFAFDHHHDSHEKAEGYLRWTNLQLSLKMSIENNWANIFNIIRLNPTTDLTGEFERLLRRLNGTVISDEHINKFRYFLRNNNPILANTVFAYEFEENDFISFVSIICATEVDCEVRSSMIGSLAGQKRRFGLEVGRQLISLLDDYTLTNQGDVGSKIRFGILKLIRSNKAQFQGLEEEMELKLVRLAGELIDRIRVEALNLLLEMRSLPTVSGDITTAQSYEQLLRFYGEQILPSTEHGHSKRLSLQFWKGFTFSVGALTANTAVVNESFRCLLQFLTIHSGAIIYQNLLTLLKVSGPHAGAREQKSYVVTLNVLVKLMEANFQFPHDFNYDALFVRCYNLQINTTNLTRIGLTLKIFHHMSGVAGEVALKCRKRVVALACTHKLAKVRQMAGETVFEIVNDLCPTSEAVAMLDRVEWSQSPAELKHIKTELEDVLNSI